MEAAATLESTIADCGVLLVTLDKFRAARGDVIASLRAEALAAGHQARRLNRIGALDEAAAEALLDGVQRLLARVRAAVDSQRSTPAYRTAVEAHAAGDHGALQRLLPAIFADLVAAPPPAALYHPVAWLRRSRPRDVTAVVADIAQTRDVGLEAVADPIAPGLDPELPAVPLAAERPADPIALRFDAAALPRSIFRVEPSGEYLAHVPRLRAAFTAVVPDALDEDDLGEISLDHPRYRAALLAALHAAGLPAVAA